MSKILIVEDDPAMAVALKDGLEFEGYTVAVARDGAEGLKRAEADKPDLVVLDVMLPRMSGLDVCKEIRRRGDKVPILMLTARGQEIDKVLGLKMGADDYVTKPFSFLELVARCEALLRRVSGWAAPLERFEFADISADFKAGELRRRGEPLEVSPREMRLLAFFAQHRGEVVSRETLLEEVWDYDTPPLTRTVDMHIAKLRRKIEEDPANPRILITVHRIGYKFTA